MRFLHISNFLEDPNSGAGGSIMSFATGLRALGNEVDLVWRDPKPFLLGPNFSRFLELPRRQFAQAQAALARQPYDVVVVHQPHAHRIYSQLAPLYPQTAFLNFSHGWELCDVTRLSVDEPNNLTRRVKNKIASYLARRDCSRAAALAHGVMVINGNDWDFLRSFHHVPFERVTVIPLGLDPRLLGLPPRQPPPPGTPPRLLYAGNYIYMKGTDLMEAALLEAARAGVDFQFTCVTHQDQHDGIRQRIGSALGSRLRLESWKPRGELIQLMNAHDILLFPSRYEGFGKMAHEAMACGMCVVGAQVGVLSDRAVDGVNALLAPPDDGPAFTAKVRAAMTDASLVARIGEEARLAVQGDTWDNTALHVEKFVRSCRIRLGMSTD